MQSELDLLLEELRLEGTLDTAGSFSLDARAARQKLARYQLDQPGLWLVKLIQFAQISGVASLKISWDGQALRTTLTFPQALPDFPKYLESFHQLAWLADPGWGHLTTSLQAALAGVCERVDLITKERQVSLTEEGLLGDATQLADPGKLTLIYHWKQPPSRWNPFEGIRWRRAMLKHFDALASRSPLSWPDVHLDGLAVQGPEPYFDGNYNTGSEVQEWLWLSPAPYADLIPYPASRAARQEHFSEGRFWGDASNRFKVSQRSWLDESGSLLPLRQTGAEEAFDLSQWLSRLSQAYSHQVRGSLRLIGVRAALMYDPKGGEPASLLPLKSGLLLSPMRLRSLPAGVRILVSLPKWRTDLSQQRVIRDATYEAVTEWARACILECVPRDEKQIRLGEQPGPAGPFPAQVL